MTRKCPQPHQVSLVSQFARACGLARLGVFHGLARELPYTAS